MPSARFASIRTAARAFVRAHRGDGTAVLDHVRGLVSDRDSWMAFEVCRAAPWAVSRMSRRDIATFTPLLTDWCSTDCFGSFVSGVAWREGGLSDRDILALARSKNRWLRRAALVSTVPLNMPARGATATRGEAEKTLATCHRLIDDRDDMVVKALSWALRALAARDPDPVRRFLQSNRDRLAPRVLREVNNKLSTGLKNPRSKPSAPRGRR